MVDIHSRQLEDFGQFQEKSISDAESKEEASDSKFILLSAGPAIYFLTISRFFSIIFEGKRNDVCVKIAGL